MTRSMKRILYISLAALVLCVILFAVYLGRYVVYTPDGVRLDFGRNTSRDVDLTTEAPVPAAPTETVPLYSL